VADGGKPSQPDKIIGEALLAEETRPRIVPSAEGLLLILRGVNCNPGAEPEDMEQKATIDAVFALALGLYTYVNPVPTVTEAPNLVQLLTQNCKEVSGGIMNVEKDPVQAAEAILAHIEVNRKKLGM